MPEQDDLNARAWALREHLGDCWPCGLVRDRMAEKDCWALGGTYIHDATAHALIGWALLNLLWSKDDDILFQRCPYSYMPKDLTAAVRFVGANRILRAPTFFGPDPFAAVLFAAEAVVAARGEVGGE